MIYLSKSNFFAKSELVITMLAYRSRASSMVYKWPRLIAFAEYVFHDTIYTMALPLHSCCGIMS